MVAQGLSPPTAHSGSRPVHTDLPTKQDHMTYCTLYALPSYSPLFNTIRDKPHLPMNIIMVFHSTLKRILYCSSCSLIIHVLICQLCASILETERLSLAALVTSSSKVNLWVAVQTTVSPGIQQHNQNPSRTVAGTISDV
jgi:hypothetical protein